MKVRNEFQIPLAADQAWQRLLDIEQVALCLPGAQITGKSADDTYEGHIAVKLGPVALRFRGTARIVDADEAARKSRLLARGTDAKGRGGVDATIDFQLEPVQGETRVLVDTDIRLTGTVAQYGRATGVIEDLANHMITDFASCLRARLDQENRAGDDRPLADADSSAFSTAPRQAAIGPGYVIALLKAALLRWLRRLLPRGR